MNKISIIWSIYIYRYMTSSSCRKIFLTLAFDRNSKRTRRKEEKGIFNDNINCKHYWALLKMPTNWQKTICSSSYTCQQIRIWFCEISLINDISKRYIYKKRTWVTAILYLHLIPHHTNNLSSIISLWNIHNDQSF